jgi:hypothetical protein
MGKDPSEIKELSHPPCTRIGHHHPRVDPSHSSAPTAAPRHMAMQMPDSREQRHAQALHGKLGMVAGAGDAPG